MKVVPQESTAANLFLDGDIDAVWIDGVDRDRLGNQAGVAEVAKPTYTMFMITMNGRAERPTSDIAVRRALASAIDRQVLADILTDSRDVPLAISNVVSTQRCYAPETEDELRPPDPDQARQVLEDAGFSLGGDGVYERDGERLEVTILASSELGPASEHLLNSFREVGIDADIRAVNPAALSEEQSRGNWDVSHSTPPSFTPGNLTIIDTFGGWENPGVDEAVVKAHAAVGEEERCQAWSDAQLAWLSEVNFVPIFEELSSWFVRDGFEFETNEEGEIAIWSMRLG